jgi:glycosyltransferase involved in cell wall biosynthesis
MDSHNIKISVVMPVYNAGEYLTRAIGDVLSQTLTDLELIIIDDGSTDNSRMIINSFMKRDKRIKLLSQFNGGPSIARNAGIAEAQGDYIIFLDADDFYEKDLLASLYEVAERDNLDIAVARFDIYNDSQNKYTAPMDEPHSGIFVSGGVTSKNEYPDFILSSTTGYVWNKLFKASFVRNMELSFDPELYVFEDVYFVCSALSLAERVGRIDQVLIHHRVYSEQSRARLFRKYYSQVPIIYKKLKEFLMHHGMYIPLKRGYLNFSAGRCYKIYNLLWDDGKERLWNMLHDGYYAEFNWHQHEKTDFESLEVYEFVANVALYSYAEYQARAEQGKNIDTEQLDKDTLGRQIQVKEKISHRRMVWNKIMDFVNIFKKNEE